MAKQQYYYQCDVNSKVGRALTKFWRKAVKAAERAEAYAKKFGASEYEPSVQFFRGGVDYLIFDKKPDERVWRKRLTDNDGVALYEPNCMYRSDVLIIPDDRFQPSNTWDKIYSKKHLSWREVQPQKTFEQWCQLAKVQRTDDREADIKRLNAIMERYHYVPFIHFYGDETAPRGSSKADVPAWLRRAIKAEQERQALPVVEVFPLFAILCMTPPVDEGTVSFSVTPEVFNHYDSWYISTEYPCVADGLHPITEGTYHYKYNMFIREEPEKVSCLN